MEFTVEDHKLYVKSNLFRCFNVRFYAYVSKICHEYQKPLVTVIVLTESSTEQQIIERVLKYIHHKILLAGLPYR